eukprot:4426543-Amphidinium_carterae.1
MENEPLSLVRLCRELAVFHARLQRAFFLLCFGNAAASRLIDERKLMEELEGCFEPPLRFSTQSGNGH